MAPPFLRTSQRSDRARPDRIGLEDRGPTRALGLVTARKSSVSTAQMRRAARRHPDRVLLIDWVGFSAGHGGWFGGDGAARQVRRGERVRPAGAPLGRARRFPARSFAAPAASCSRVEAVRCRPPLRASLRVYVLRGRSRELCARARALVRRPPLRAIPNWRRYDWRRTRHGPWPGVRPPRPQGDRRRHRRRLTAGAAEGAGWPRPAGSCPVGEQ